MLHIFIQSVSLSSGGKINPMKQNNLFKPGSIFLCIALLVAFGTSTYGQKDTTALKSKEKVKTGLNFGALPAVAFDSDIGFQYGLLANLFQYGDGSTYPDYRWSLYAEWSRTTKGSGINQLFFDSKYLLPHQIRITADVSFLTEQTLDFYGFKGYESIAS